MKTELDALIEEAEAAERKARQELLDQGVPPEVIVQFEEELRAAMDRLPTPEEEEQFALIVLLCKGPLP